MIPKKKLKLRMNICIKSGISRLPRIVADGTVHE